MSASSDRISKKVGFWDKVSVALTPGDALQRENRLNKIADDNEAEERRKAQLEAIRNKRMAGGS